MNVPAVWGVVALGGVWLIGLIIAAIFAPIAVLLFYGLVGLGLGMFAWMDAR